MDQGFKSQTKKKSSYIKDWEQFVELCVEIILSDPRARATIKYNDHKQNAILKVTDDRRIVLFKVKAQKQITQTGLVQKIQSKLEDQHLNRIEQFINVTTKLMLKCNPEETIKEPQKIEEESKGKKKKGKGKK